MRQSRCLISGNCERAQRDCRGGDAADAGACDGRCCRSGSALTVIVKHENHTPIGAFKVRGGLVYVDRLKRERPQTAGLISATRGNHGQSLAFAGKPLRSAGDDLWCRAAIRSRRTAPCGPSAPTLVEHGDDFQEAREEAYRRADAGGLEIVPAFHPDLVLGVATYALELLRKARRTSMCSMCRSGRAPASAAASWRAICLGLSTEIVGVQSTLKRRPMRCRSRPARW